MRLDQKVETRKYILCVLILFPGIWVQCTGVQSLREYRVAVFTIECRRRGSKSVIVARRYL